MRLGPVIFPALMLLTSCSERVAPPEQTAEAFAVDPERLQETLKRCKADRAAVGDDVCLAASEAFRKRFMGDGKPNYNPQAVDLFPQTPDKTIPKPITKREPSKE